ncbi:MAG TPA: DUF3597 family protein [Anaerolineales bacterium]|nr:DUF3597 family protein [Anaerolineales bacterium]
MGFFSKILEKLGIKKKEETPAAPVAPAAPAKPAASTAKPAAPAAHATQRPERDEPLKNPAAGAGASHGMPAHIKAEEDMPVKAIEVVDVVAQLEERAAKQTLKLNWKTSIADLLFLLDLDNSKDARIELAKELGCPDEFIGGDYSKMNAWLHKEVLRQIALNGGNIPQELLD